MLNRPFPIPETMVRAKLGVGNPHGCIPPDDLPGGFTPHDGGMGYRDHILPGDWIEPIYRGPEDPAKGIRRAYGVAMAFNWTHDGSPDDIIAFRPAKWQEGDPA